MTTVFAWVLLALGYLFLSVGKGDQAVTLFVGAMIMFELAELRRR